MASSTSEANVALIKRLLANALKPDVLSEIVAPDATYISLTYDNPSLTKILPWAGTSRNGAAAVTKAFGGVEQHWLNESFEVLDAFGDGGENVAVFGKFTYRSRTLKVANTSPFSSAHRIGSYLGWTVRYLASYAVLFDTCLDFWHVSERCKWTFGNGIMA